MHIKNAIKAIKADLSFAKDHVEDDRKYVKKAAARLQKTRERHAAELAADRADLRDEKAVLAGTCRYYLKKFGKTFLKAVGAELKAVGKFLLLWLWQVPVVLIAAAFVGVAALLVMLGSFSVSRGVDFFNYAVFD